MRKVREVRE
jgi:pre-mRNA-splicing factor ATP-dependent RNA helicase DHX38/PRP16